MKTVRLIEFETRKQYGLLAMIMRMSRADRCLAKPRARFHSPGAANPQTIKLAREDERLLTYIQARRKLLEVGLSEGLLCSDVRADFPRLGFLERV